ncbi:hypothetical protein JMUB7527_28520 [Staphylococcus aureus]
MCIRDRSKSSDALFNSLTQSFELIEGVYNELVTDNLKIVMYKPRKESPSGRINRRFK